MFFLKSVQLLKTKFFNILAYRFLCEFCIPVKIVDLSKQAIWSTTYSGNSDHSLLCYLLRILSNTTPGSSISERIDYQYFDICFDPILAFFKFDIFPLKLTLLLRPTLLLTKRMGGLSFTLSNVQLILW